MTDDPPDVTSSVVAASFDDRTTAWFVVLCGSLASVGDNPIPSYPSVADGGVEPPLEQTRSRALSDYAELRSILAAAVSGLDGQPTPTLEGGDRMASDVLASLRAMVQVAGDAPGALRAATTSAELAAAMDDLRTRMRDAEDLVPDDSPLVSDEVTAAMAKLPACRPLVGD